MKINGVAIYIYFNTWRENISPAKLIISPEKLYISPEKLIISPKKLKISPEKLNISPGEAEHFTGEAEHFTTETLIIWQQNFFGWWVNIFFVYWKTGSFYFLIVCTRMHVACKGMPSRNALCTNYSFVIVCIMSFFYYLLYFYIIPPLVTALRNVGKPGIYWKRETLKTMEFLVKKWYSWPGSSS